MSWRHGVQKKLTNKPSAMPLMSIFVLLAVLFLPLHAKADGSPGLDARDFGATCGTLDSTSGIQSAVNTASTTGIGVVVISCPMTVAGEVAVAGDVRLTGRGPMYYPGMTDTPGPAVWPISTGPAISCTSTTQACILVNGEGVEIDHINFGNNQPTPPSSGTTWSPTVYPFIIGTTATSNWQGLYLHDLSFTSTSKAVDLEGGYCISGGVSTCYSGSQIRISHMWCNPCLNLGLEVHKIDNPLIVDHWEYTSSWYFNNAAVGAYIRANAVGIDLHYSAAPQLANLNFFALKSGITTENDTVTNNFGNVTLGVSFGQFTNVMFNQVCQAVTMPSGNGTIASAAFTNVAVWGDQSGFNCSRGLPMFGLQSNFADFSFSQVQVYDIDTFAAIGCGATGSACGTTSGAGILRLNDIDVQCYSCFSAGQAFILAPSGAYVGFGITNMAAIRPSGTYSAGKLMGPGPDATQAYMGCL